MIKQTLRFSVTLVLILTVAFSIQGYIQHRLDIGFFEKHLLLCYVFNFILTILFYITLLIFKEKKSNQLGFIFLFSSMTKFLLFFIFIKPFLTTSNGINIAEFLAFFVPYGVSLFLEVNSLIRLMNQD
ncbi:MAG: hypothetical protein COA33_006370 [Fluviicola sp.]|nr:hypothetical protein [Fluviicola sp.]